ncbi:VOC family protein [Diaminobutyricimonas sp. LJ205]|uniref:VOC family protein n=1 Tax=Diaminobutyricimonas sp. LJ205 TaxID=2683590 RepID=UPI0012F50A52|nr:VOC family protein [Diaminobutyricimonas sp. LJ205]
MITELNHIAILTRDLTESVDFYEGRLGGTVAWTGEVPAIGLRFVYVQLGGGFIELLHMPQVAADRPLGVDHIGFITDDVDADFAALMDAGFEAQQQPQTAGSGNGRTAFLSDPNGARVELLQRDTPVPDPSIVSDTVLAIDHIAVHARDLDGAFRFYRDGLGLQHLRTINIPDSDFALGYVGLDGHVLELHSFGAPAGLERFPHIALRVGNLDAALATIGVNPEAGTPRPLQSGPGRMAEILDPNGVTLELVERA